MAKPPPGMKMVESNGGRWQFSLRTLLVVVTVFAVLCALAATFPGLVVFVSSRAMLAFPMTLLFLFPLTVVAAVDGSIRFVLSAAGAVCAKEACAVPKITAKRLLGGPFRLLSLSVSSPPANLSRAFLVAVASMGVLVGLWPLLREVGLQLALSSMLKAPPWLLPGELTSSRFWTSLWIWEIWSLARWLLLFGLLAAIWFCAPRVRTQREHCSGWTGAGRRLLLFSPWLIVVEMGFLIGVWVESPDTVPEPSTLFTAGAFSWDQWTWTCWLQRVWLIRGVLPTLVAGSVFFRGVIGMRWFTAVAAACFLVPIALLLSVAWTRLYIDLILV